MAVTDVKSCDDPQPAASADSGDPRFYIIAGGIVGSIILIVVILLIVFIVRRNSLRRRKFAQKPLSQGQLEELKLKILKECERESALCRKGESQGVCVFVCVCVRGESQGCDGSHKECERESALCRKGESEGVGVGVCVGGEGGQGGMRVCGVCVCLCV